MVLSKKQFKFLYGTIANPERSPPPPISNNLPLTPGVPKLAKKTYLLNGKRYWLCFNVIQQHLINKITNCTNCD